MTSNKAVMIRLQRLTVARFLKCKSRRASDRKMYIQSAGGVSVIVSIPLATVRLSLCSPTQLLRRFTTATPTKPCMVD